jgi:CheY-like chemotaxis protein
MTPPTVLVVDDDEAIRMTVCEALALCGRVGVSAEEGQAALALLRGGLRPAMVLLDLRMPGMNGWDFRRELLRDPDLAKIPVVILSCESISPDMNIAAQLRKPFEIADLFALVRRLS